MAIRKIICWLLIGFLLAPQSALLAQVENDYIIGPHDGLMIRVVTHSELDKQVQVAPDGYILFPPVQEAIKAEGLTTKKLALKLAITLKKYITGGNPEVLVNVSSYNSQQVSVLGMVKQPGVYGFISIPNMMEVIMRAGGPLPQAELKEVKILRGDKTNPQIINIDIAKFLKEGDFSILPALQPGDMVFIPAPAHFTREDEVTDEAAVDAPEEPEVQTIHIMGEVVRPGNYLLPETKEMIPLVEALLVAGGGPNAIADLSRVRIVRGARNEKAEGYQVETINFNDFLKEGSMVGNPQIYPTDTIYVPQASIDGPMSMARLPKNTVIYVTGQVLRPGSYVIEDNSNIWKAISLAGGPTSESKLSSTYLVSHNAESNKNARVKIDLKRIMKGKDISPILNEGDTIIVGQKKHFWRNLVGIIRDLSSVAIAYGTISLAAEQAKTNK